MIVTGLLAAWQQEVPDTGSDARIDIPLTSYRPPVRPVLLSALAAVAVPETDAPALPAFAAQ